MTSGLELTEDEISDPRDAKWKVVSVTGVQADWAVIASLIETCKLNGVDPHIYLTDVITKIVDGHSNSRIDELLP